MTNCFSVDNVPYDKSLFTDFETIGSRASSFDLMLFKLPCEFDEGRGYEYMSDFWVQNKKLKITEGSTWYQSKSGIPGSINNADNKIFAKVFLRYYISKNICEFSCIYGCRYSLFAFILHRKRYIYVYIHYYITSSCFFGLVCRRHIIGDLCKNILWNQEL
jgi:hypothetical protein